MTIQELLQFIGTIFRSMMLDAAIRNICLATTTVVMLYAFTTNHLSIRRILLYLGMFLLMIVGLEWIRFEYRVNIGGILASDWKVLLTPAVFDSIFFLCIWLGICLGYCINRVLYVSFGDPWMSLAVYLEGIAAGLRLRSKEISEGDITSWEELRTELIAHAKAKRATLTERKEAK
jgi:hypothetical protein